VLLVAWLLCAVLKNFTELKTSNAVNFTHSNIIEIVWTSLPALILLSLASPSFSLLYSLDEVRFYGASYAYSNHQIECDQDDILQGSFCIIKKQVFRVNQSMRVRVYSPYFERGV
jgi:heme/copper-type cytochrome/quinol oxidase subunit 2